MGMGTRQSIRVEWAALSLGGDRESAVWFEWEMSHSVAVTRSAVEEKIQGQSRVKSHRALLIRKGTVEQSCSPALPVPGSRSILDQY